MGNGKCGKPGGGTDMSGRTVGMRGSNIGVAMKGALCPAVVAIGYGVVNDADVEDCGCVIAVSIDAYDVDVTATAAADNSVEGFVVSLQTI